MKTEELKKIETSLTEMQTVLTELRQNPTANADKIATIEGDIDFLQKRFNTMKNNVAAKSESFHFKPSISLTSEVPSLDAQIKWIAAYAMKLKMELESDPQPWMEEDLVYQEAILQSLIGVRNILAAEERKEVIDANLIAGFEKPFTLDSQFVFVKELINKIGTCTPGSNKRKLAEMLGAIEQNLSVARWVGQTTADILLERKGNRPGETTPEEDLFDASVKALALIHVLEPQSTEDREDKKQLLKKLETAIKIYAGDDYHFADEDDEKEEESVLKALPVND